MKRRIFRIYIIVMGLIIILLGVYNKATAEEYALTSEGENALASEVEDASVKEGLPEINSANISSEYALPPEENSDNAQLREYVKGQLIVKLKKGYTLTNIQELNEKYKVNSAEKVFNETQFTDENTLSQLKQKLSRLNAKHDNWYWQLEKDSIEYKDYMNRIEKEKKDLNEKIAIEEEIPADKKQEIASPDVHAANLENVFVQNVPEETDLLLMADDYRKNPAVEYAELNYIAQEQTISKN